jgi:hypothetical protein
MARGVAWASADTCTAFSCLPDSVEIVEAITAPSTTAFKSIASIVPVMAATPTSRARFAEAETLVVEVGKKMSPQK